MTASIFTKGGMYPKNSFVNRYHNLIIISCAAELYSYRRVLPPYFLIILQSYCHVSFNIAYF